LLTDVMAGRTGAYPQNWGSPHIAGPQFAFADGAVRTVSFATNGSVVWALLTPTGNEPVSLNDF
jgi:hypothetical protein